MMKQAVEANHINHKNNAQIKNLFG